MKRIEEYDDLLWGYIDSSISSKEREELELKLAENNHLRERLNELKSISSFTKENIILSPKENFTKLVMSKIEGIDFQPKKSHWLLVLIVIMTVMGGGFYISEFSTAVQLNLQSPELPLVEKYLPIDGFELNKHINLNEITKIMLYAITFLALLFFDKAILKPYFKARRLAH